MREAFDIGSERMMLRVERGKGNNFTFSPDTRLNQESPQAPHPIDPLAAPRYGI